MYKHISKLGSDSIDRIERKIVSPPPPHGVPSRWREYNHGWSFHTMDHISSSLTHLITCLERATRRGPSQELPSTSAWQYFFGWYRMSIPCTYRGLEKKKKKKKKNPSVKASHPISKLHLVIRGTSDFLVYC